MRIGILALQGAFIEHEKMLAHFGIKAVALRQAKDLVGIDGLILPGGESTVQGKLLAKLQMLAPLRERIADGLPVMGTCAGLILLAEELAGDPAQYFATLPVSVCRNAYGRQLGSFETTGEVSGIGKFPLVFIRAPRIARILNPNVTILCSEGGSPVAVRFRNQLGLSFHPELTADDRLHRYFVNMI